MRTRRTARLRSASLPPPISPSSASQAKEVSNVSNVPENADPTWSSQGIERRDEPAVRINNPNSDEARIGSCPSLEEGKEELGSVNLELGSGSHDPPAQGAVDDGFVTPLRYAKNIKGSSSSASLSSNEQYFPAWFSNPRVGKSQKNKKFVWSDSSPYDDLPDIEDLVLPSHSGKLTAELPNIEPHTSLEVELAEILGMHSSNDVLRNRMRRIDIVDSMGSDSDSVISERCRDEPKRRSKYGNYKRPKRLSRSRSHSPWLEVNAVDFDQAADQSGLEDLRSDSRTEGPSTVPYLMKGKYKAFSDNEQSDHSNKSAHQAQIAVDHQIALELERRLNEEARKSKKLEKRNKQMARKMQAMEDNAKKPREPSQTVSGTRKSHTPLGIGSKPGRASSRLPEKSGLRRAMPSAKPPDHSGLSDCLGMLCKYCRR